MYPGSPSILRCPSSSSAPPLRDQLTEGLDQPTMEFPHEGGSIYYRYQAAFARHWDGDLLFCNGPQSALVRKHWHSFNFPLTTRNDAASESGRLDQVQLGGHLQGLTLYEYRQASSGLVTGILLKEVIGAASLEKDFESFFSRLILHQVNFAVSSQATPIPSGRYELATERIASLFDTYLRYQGQDDKWIESGRAYFTERIRHFTSQRKRVEFCLPAFPCKSSNTDKVTGKDPDRGEQLALERLHSFVEIIEQLYGPGAKLWIISDGHVFSDCIGVDDQDVDTYSEKLIEMNRVIGLKHGNPDRVGFKSLVDLFELERYESQWGLSQIAGLFGIPTIDHHVETRLTVEAELCREILMAGCQSRRSSLRNRIDSQDAAILALYRGFSRFMLEDLELHPFTRAMSRSKQKKLSAKVAFEMIMRNQAYSNLVEMLLPNHVRLSIHAHNNAGPKFGIQLFDPLAVRAVESLSPDSCLMTSRDLLHIPTPWHNSVVKVVGSNTLYVTKAKVVREAIAAGDVTGLVIGGADHGGAGTAYFSVCASTLTEVELKEREAPKQEESHTESPIVTLSREGIASLTISPNRYLAAGSTTLACESEYVFV
ncbi:Pyoverdine/dityrosine biosynthesis protein-domain-containing protein [Hypoxylon crocopeplum]|nr:Pyoverdine/dityrosine biosynthesis protein-domain-containing protein [Hypoxylon crocopeplum]